MLGIAQPAEMCSWICFLMPFKVSCSGKHHVASACMMFGATTGATARTHDASKPAQYLSQAMEPDSFHRTLLTFVNMRPVPLPEVHVPCKSADGGRQQGGLRDGDRADVNCNSVQADFVACRQIRHSRLDRPGGRRQRASALQHCILYPRLAAMS